MTGMLVGCCGSGDDAAKKTDTASQEKKEDTAPPPVIESTIHIVRFRLNEVADLFYYLDTKVHVCVSKLQGSDIGMLMPQDVCDRLIATYVPAATEEKKGE